MQAAKNTTKAANATAAAKKVEAKPAAKTAATKPASKVVATTQPANQYTVVMRPAIQQGMNGMMGPMGPMGMNGMMGGMGMNGMNMMNHPGSFMDGPRMVNDGFQGYHDDDLKDNEDKDIDDFKDYLIKRNNVGKW